MWKLMSIILQSFDISNTYFTYFRDFCNLYLCQYSSSQAFWPSARFNSALHFNSIFGETLFAQCLMFYVYTFLQFLSIVFVLLNLFVDYEVETIHSEHVNRRIYGIKMRIQGRCRCNWTATVEDFYGLILIICLNLMQCNSPFELLISA